MMMCTDDCIKLIMPECNEFVCMCKCVLAHCFVSVHIDQYLHMYGGKCYQKSICIVYIDFCFYFIMC